MRKYEDQTPPSPEEGCFYATFNNSIVYICEIDCDGDTKTIILKSGTGRKYRHGHYGNGCGDSYYLSEDGYHKDKDKDKDVGYHLVLGIREKLDIQLHSID